MDMDIGNVGRNIPIERTSDIQKTQKGEVHTGVAGLPSSQTVGEELKSRGAFNAEGVQSALKGLQTQFKDGSSGKDFPIAALNELVMAPLASPKGVAAAAKIVAEELNKSGADASLADVMKNMIRLTFLKGL